MAEGDKTHSILVVEDESLVRLAIADYLRECGFQVLEAATGIEAFNVLASHAAIDLVFSDIDMPGSMDGFGLARWIRAHRPGMKIILTSGMAEATVEAADLCDGGSLISKPYFELSLVERISRLLAAA